MCASKKGAARRSRDTGELSPAEIKLGFIFPRAQLPAPRRGRETGAEQVSPSALVPAAALCWPSRSALSLWNKQLGKRDLGGGSGPGPERTTLTAHPARLGPQASPASPNQFSLMCAHLLPPHPSSDWQCHIRPDHVELLPNLSRDKHSGKETQGCCSSQLRQTPRWPEKGTWPPASHGIHAARR